MSTPLTGGRDAGSRPIHVTADTAGIAANGVTVTIAGSRRPCRQHGSRPRSCSGNIVVSVRGTVDLRARSPRDQRPEPTTARRRRPPTGDQNYIDTADTAPVVGNLGGGVAATGGLTQDVVFRAVRPNGSEVFSVRRRHRIADLAAGINARATRRASGDRQRHDARADVERLRLQRLRRS